MRSKPQSWILLGLLPSIVFAGLTSKPPTGNCKPHKRIGQSQYCCVGGCSTDVCQPAVMCSDITGHACGKTQLLQNAKMTTPSTGGVCYNGIYACDWKNVQYNYQCCDCSAGFRTLAASPYCDSNFASCIGCSESDEVLIGHSQADAQCVKANQTCVVSDTNCNFYKCLESKYHCEGTDYSYPLDYGYKYCKKYEASRSSFHTAGKEWIKKVQVCPQQDLVPYAEGGSTCPKIQNFAFASHPDCYVNSGVCTLFLDWIHIAQTVGVEGLIAGETQAAKTALMCLEQWASYGPMGLTRLAIGVANFFASPDTELANTVLELLGDSIRTKIRKLIAEAGVTVPGL